MPQKIIYPASYLLKDFLPTDLLMGVDEAIDFLAVDPDFIEVNWTNTGLATRYRFYILQNLSFDLPLLSGISIHLGTEPDYLPHFDLSFQSNPIPRFGIENLKLSLQATPNLLQAFEKDGEVWRPTADVNGYHLTWETGLHVDINGKFDFQSPELIGVPPFMIGDTGFIIDFSESVSSDSAADIRWINSDAPAELIAKLPPNFTGMYIERAGIHYYKTNSGTRLPRFGLEDAAISTGGFSGSAIVGDEREEPNISAERLNAEDFDPTELEGDHIVGLELAGMELILWHFRLSFYQSIPNACLLTGLVFIPFADKWMKFKAAIGGPDADFMLEIGGAGNAGLVGLDHEWFQIIVDSIRYELRQNEHEESIHYAIINGSIKPKIADFDWPTLKVEPLTISSKGDIELDGGWIDVPETFTLDFHAFKIDINQIGMGNEEPEGETGGDEEMPNRQWFGFSGGITLVEGIPLSASVRGLKFSWNASDGSDLRVSLEGIAVHLEIPNTLILDGSVRYQEITRAEAEALPERASRLYGHVFTGSVTLNITALNTMVNGELLIGDLTDLDTGESFTAFYIVLNVQLPTAIPLGATGTGLYGLAGLVGIHVAPDRQLADSEPEPWYLWYKNPKPGISGTEYNITKVAKWAPRFDNFAFGAGLSLGTVYDDGFTINVGALVVILVPGPVVLIEGRANLLKQRGEGNGKNAEGALYALIVFDGLAETFQMNVDVNYTLEDVITVGGGMEAFFDFNDSSNWYIYIGQKEPESKRIRAEVISIISASAYFMIDPMAIQFGAAAGIDLRLEYNPLLIRLLIRLRFEIALFFKEPQLTGLVELYIELSIKIFGIGLELILQALLEGSAPQPWWIYGKARAALNLPFPLPSFDVEVEFTWGEDSEPARVELFKSAAMIHPKQIGSSWALSMSPGEAPVVPVDAIPVLSCGKPISFVSTEPDPEDANGIRIRWFLTETVEGWEFGYDIQSIVLSEVETGTDIKNYEANGFTEVGELNTLQQPWFYGGGIYQLPVETKADASSETGSEDSSAGQTAKNIQEPQILLWQYSPLSALHPGYHNQYVNLCRTTQDSPHEHCVNWQNVSAGTTYPAVFSYKNLLFAIPLGNSLSQVVRDSQLGQGLETNGLTIRFPEPVVNLKITFRNTSANIASYYRGQILPEAAGVKTPVNGSFLLYEVFDSVDTVKIPVVVDNISSPLSIPTFITEICYVTQRDQESFWGETDSSSESTGTEMADSLFLMPHTLYSLTVSAQRRERKVGETTFTTQPQDPVTYYFKTALAPGKNLVTKEIRNPEADPAAKVDFRDGALNRLETYIERTVPENGASLFYRGYRVLIEFNEPYFNGTYINNLYADGLSLRVKDRNGKTLLGRGSTALTVDWLNSALPLLTSGLLTVLTAPSQADCSDQRPGWQQFENQYLSCILPDTVRPGKMYSIEVVSDDKALYQFQFATSRYRDIVEHLQSGLSHDESGVVTSREQMVRRGLSALPSRPNMTWLSRYTRLQDQVVEDRRQLWFALEWSTEAVRTLPEAQVAIKESKQVLHTFCSETYNWLDRGGNHPDSEFSSLSFSGTHSLFEAVGLGHRPLPPKVELLQISVTSSSNYLLLLESPEPIEWQRLQLRIGTQVLNVIWSDDQTRAFIFNESTGGLFAAGTYEFTFECNLGTSSAPDLQPLYKADTSTSETITWNVEIE